MHPGNRRWRRLIVLLAAAVVVVTGGVAAAVVLPGLVRDRLADPGTVAAPGEGGPTLVDVERRDLAETVAATGSLVMSRSVVLGFPGPGEVTELSVAVGDAVTAGQVLARQDPRLGRIELESAEAALVSAQRAAGLRGPATAAERGAAEARAAEGRATVAAARDALDTAREVAVAEAAARDSAVASAERRLAEQRRLRDQAAATAGAVVAPPPGEVAAADAELDASRAAVVRARDAEAAAGRALAEAVASGDADRIAREQARLDAAALATAAAEARTGDAQAEVDGLAAARAAADEARAALSAADAAVFEAEEAVVAAQDARRTGAAVDAQTVAAAESEVERARAALRVLETDGGPGAADGGAGGTSPEEARVAVKRAELAVERARAALDRLTIVAPTDGTVTAVKAQLGQVLGDDGAPAGDTGAAGDGGAGGTAAGDAGGTGGGTVGTSPADVITITTPQQLVAEIDVAETEAIDLRSGMPAELKYAAVPDFVGRGTVLTVTPASTSGSGGGPAGGDPYADAGGGSGAQGRRYTVAIGLSDPPDGVRGGLTVAARVTIATVEDVLAVPTAALTQADGRVTVQRVVSEDGREGPATEEVEVGTGVRQGGWTEVVDGLSPGDRVLVTGAPVEGDPGAFEEVGLVG